MDAFVGEIRIFAGTFAPVGWLMCDGSIQNISSYQNLFSIIGNTYGGDGQTTFGLPDLRSRAPVHMGQGSGLSNYALAQSGGAESVTLTTAQMAAHAHPASASTTAATTTTPGSSVTYGAVQTDAQHGILGLYTQLVPPDVTAVQMAPSTVGPAGAGAAHDNSMSTLPVNFIIATDGPYPSAS